MSSNVSALDQAQAVAPTPAPGFSHSSSHLSVLPPNNGELQGDVQQAPAFLGPIHIPIPNAPSKELIKSLANLIAQMGPAVGALYASQYHKSLNQANSPTADELLLRVLDTRANLTQEKYVKYHQGSPNAVALRFLAPNAGQGYPFMKFKTGEFNSKGNPITNWMCGCPGCPYTGRDRNRHAEETHVKNPVFTVCCPYLGCNFVQFAGSLRFSEMDRHMADHEKQNSGEKKGRRGFMPLSTYNEPWLW